MGKEGLAEEGGVVRRVHDESYHWGVQFVNTIRSTGTEAIAQGCAAKRCLEQAAEVGVERLAEREYFRDRDDTKMTIVLDSKPATTEDVAKILGVPKSRVKWLKRLVEARTFASAKTTGKRFAVKAERKKTESTRTRKRTSGTRKKAAH